MGLVGSALPALCQSEPAFALGGIFYRRGKQTLLFASSFRHHHQCPPPLAGSMKMRPQIFCNSTAWALRSTWAHTRPRISLSDALRAITRGLRSAGFAAEVIFGIALAAYLVYRIWIYRKYRLLDVTPRIPPTNWPNDSLPRQPRNMLIADVRSHGYYDADPNASRIDPHRTQKPTSKRSSTCPRIARFISTALERAKHQRPCGASTPGSGIQGFSLSQEACAPGAKPDTRWNASQRRPD